MGVTGLTNKTKSLEENIKDKTIEVVQQSKVVEDLKKTISGTKLEANEKATQFEKLKDTNTNLRNEIEKKKREALRQENDFVKLRDQVTGMYNTMKNLKEKNKVKTSQQESKVNELREQIMHLQRENRFQKLEAKQHISDIGQMESIIDDRESKVLECKSKI